MTSMEAEHQYTVVGVRFTKVGKLYHFDYSDFPDLQPGEFVIVETARGRHMGQVMGFAAADDQKQDYRPILRAATPRDMVLRQEWESREPEALVICREKAHDLGGFEDVKFVAAQYNYDGSVVTFLFSAEQKVNVGRLADALKREFRQTQIEMRQIGPRDVAKLLGGYGACGELRCCSTFLTDFSPISIKMAKAQGISLNPSEITGMCGRLRCCLVYEYEQYVAARSQLPKKNKRVGTPLGLGKVIDVHPLQDAVTVWIDEEGRRQFQREELIPMEEFEALQKKAQEPCSKHGDEPCDCGKPPGERMADQVQPAADVTNQAPADTDVKAEIKPDAVEEKPTPQDKTQDGPGGKERKGGRRRSRRGGRRRRGQGKNPRSRDGDNQNNKKDAKDSSKKNDKQ